MRLCQFRCLSAADQEYYLKEKAVVIGTICGHEGIHTLFQVDGFYLEVLTDQKLNIINTLCYEEELELLDPFLGDINIEPIYSILYG